MKTRRAPCCVLQTVKASLDATGEGATFSYFILSDTDRADVASAEDALVAAWRASDIDRDRIVYRRRAENTGYKAGNVRDFCDRWGGGFELMLPLDADSLMTGEAIRRLVRIMQAHPKIGILQSLVVGMPSSSAFARIFQFGMRARYARLHDGASVVGWRLRALLGPQRACPHQAVRRTLRSADAAGQAAARRACAVA